MRNRNLDSYLDRFLERDPLLTAEQAVALTGIVASGEYLTTKDQRSKGGLNYWPLAEKHFRYGLGKLWQGLSEEELEQYYKLLASSRLVVSSALAAPAFSNNTRGILNAYLALSQLVMQPRHFWGTDGSDQLSLLVNLSAAIGRLGGTERTKTAAEDFLALQVVLSYFIAGIAKAPGSSWTNGDALERIMATQSYGDKGFYDLLRKYPAVGQSITRGTVVLESFMPLSLLHSGVLKLTLLVFASFHLANARFMGLGRFVLPFVSTYPAVWQLHKRVFRGRRR